MRGETKRKLLAVFSVCICVCVIIAAGMLGQKYVDFEEYTVFEYSGINGYASVKCSVDTDKLYEELCRNENNADKLRYYREFVDSVSVINAQMDLSNGDRVYAKVNYDEALAKQAGVRVGSDDVEVRASGITDGQEVDLFNDVEVVFTGISPDAGVVINNKHKDEFFATLTYSADKVEDIEVGDSVTVTCNVSEAELGRSGYVAKSLTQVYKADHLSTYAESAEQVSDSIKLDIQKEIETAIVKLTEDSTFRMMYKATGDTKYLRMGNTEKASNIQFECATFLKKKANVTVTDETDNYLCYMYSADVTIGEETEKVYFVVEYKQGYITYENEFMIVHGDVDKRYTCSTNYESIVSSTLVGGKYGYSTMEVAKCTTKP